MEFSVGDGYTYSADVTYPIVYESKEKAIEDFELLLLDKVEKIEQANIEKEKVYNDSNKLTNQFHKIKADKRLNEKYKNQQSLEVYEKINKHREEQVIPLEDKIKEIYTINFGGQNFSLDDFIYFHEDNPKKAGYCTPTISTLNEYFSSIENTLLNQKKIKP